ncbi:MAG: 4-hydroxy-tetrahydrodipicolinate reductase [Ottowia sp.]|nr:4-hydroxy-tetrahydrodipicolinate reductase [Ottowia sp.]
MKIAISGVSGRMGRTLVEAVLGMPTFTLVGAIDHDGSAAIGHDPAAFLGRHSGVTVTADMAVGLAQAEVLIDFTRPEGTMAYLAVARKMGVKLVVGTTGLDDRQKQAIKSASEQLAIVYAPNMGVGVNATFKLAEMAAKILHGAYDVEIIEAHHRHKVDAPSGTALHLGEVVAHALGRDLQTCATYTRFGHTGERKPDAIGFSTIRGGDIVGDHTVLFAGEGERIEITHKSSSRLPYAHGALRAAHFLQNKNQGLFDMQDVLGLRTLPIDK